MKKISLFIIFFFIVQVGPLLAKESPLEIMKQIYETASTSELMKIFEENFKLLIKNPILFLEVLKDVYSHNDNVNLQELEKKAELSIKDRVRLGIRILARCIFCMGEIKANENDFIKMLNAINNLPQDWRVSYYYRNVVYNAMAKVCPSKLYKMTNSKEVMMPVLALIALLRSSYKIDQNKLEEFLEGSNIRDSYPIVYYIKDPQFKIEYLKKQLAIISNLEYFERCWYQREILNALGSFGLGRKYLKHLKSKGHIDYLKIKGIYFGFLTDSGLRIEEIAEYTDTLKKSSKYIRQVNNKFRSKEKIFYVDITPDEYKGKSFLGAGWGEDSLFISMAQLKETPRAVSFVILHEACEQQFMHGKFSRELGMIYINAFANGALEVFRLGRRIGGKYIKSVYGHPWDSEKEWLAEVGSAWIIGEKLSDIAKPVLRAIRKIAGK